MKIKSSFRLAFPLATAIAALLAASSLQAGQIWDGGGDGNWNTPANWDSDTLPTFSSPITFAGNLQNTAVSDLATATIIGGINFTNDGSGINSNAFTLSGASITLGGDILTTANTAGATITDTISLPMILDGNRTITTNQQSPGVQHNLTVSGIISETGGARGLIKDGAGTLILTGANSFTGVTTISAGILQIGAGGTIGALGTGTVTNNAALHLNRTAPLNTTVPVSNVISGTGSLTINALSTLATNAPIDIRGNNTYSGGTVVNTGILRLSTDAGGRLGNGTVNVVNGASYMIWAGNTAVTLNNNIVLNGATGLNGRSSLNQDGGNGKVTLSGTVALNSTSDIGLGGFSTNNLDITGVISGPGGMIVRQQGGHSVASSGRVLSLTAANTYAGGTTIATGVLAVGVNNGGANGDNISPDGTSTSLSSGAVTVAAGAALHINSAGLTIANDITLNGLSYGVNSGGPTATNGGPWNGAIMGNSESGVTSNIFSGTITLNATSNVSTNWNDKTMIITGKVTGVGGLTIDNSAPISGRLGGVVQIGNTTNDYAGTTTVNNGNGSGVQPTLRLGASNVIPDGAGKGNVNVLGNLNLNSFSETVNGLTGSGVINNSVAATTSTLTVGNNNANGSNYSGAIQNGSGTVALTKIGTGGQILSGVSNYSGGTTISAGTIEANNSSALGTGSVSVAAGAKLFANANNMTIANNITLNGTTPNGAIYSGPRPGGNVNNFTGQITLNATSNISHWWNDKTLQFSGKITGNAGLDFVLQPSSVGGRYFITGATNDYTGATSVTGSALPQFTVYSGQAMLYLGATNALPTTTVLTLNYADLYLNGQSQTLPSISGTGSFSVQNGSTTPASLTLGSGDTTSTFNGAIKDNGLPVTYTAADTATTPTLTNGKVALAKIGSGTLTLGGINTYTGDTTVNAGTLALADNAQLKFVLGATSGTNNSISGVGTVSLEGDFVIDTTAADALATGSWTLENVPLLGGAYGDNFTVVGFTDAGGNLWTKPNGAKTYTFNETTGTLSLTGGDSYASWIAGFPGVGLLNGVTDDADNDGIDNGVEMVIGGNPATGMDTALMPTIELVTNPPSLPAGDYLLFTYRRTAVSETALVAASCETDSDLVAPWTPAVNAVSGVVIQEDLNFSFTPSAPADTDRVRVYVPRGVNTKLFGRLNVSVP